MNAAAVILERVREALRLKAPLPHVGAAGGDRPPAGTAPDCRAFLPAVGPAFEDWVSLFRRQAEQLRADFRLLEDAAALTAALRALRDREGWRRVAAHPGELTDLATAALGLPVCRVDGTHDVRELEQCDVGVSGCEVLVAQTGTVVVTSRGAGGRALSCLPPHHVVLAHRDQLVPDLPEAFARLQARCGPDYPSMISFITGPSRTGDIERILVLGAHGPRQLTILCC